MLKTYKLQTNSRSTLQYTFQFWVWLRRSTNIALRVEAKLSESKVNTITDAERLVAYTRAMQPRLRRVQVSLDLPLGDMSEFFPVWRRDDVPSVRL